MRSRRAEPLQPIEVGLFPLPFDVRVVGFERFPELGERDALPVEA